MDDLKSSSGAGALRYRDITKVLPHRYPFLLVDRVVEVVVGQRVRAYKNVSANEPFFSGHFPGLPVMPGVLQLEALAQTTAVLVCSMEDFDPETEIAFLTGVDGARFRRPVEPGDRLDLEVEVDVLRRRICKVRARATVDGERTCDALITAVVAARPG